jgi:phosphoglycerate dehydrogenase-like enzyme
VFSTEPLPETSPLWSHPDILITPHIAAVSKPKYFAQLFVENYRRFVEGKQMRYVIDWKTGY